MSRPALLDKLFQAGKTLFKPALIPVDNTTIKVVDDKLAVQKATATTIGGIKISGEDGLVMKSDGSAAVDFDAMPTDKFEAMLKSIRVPIWLTGNKSFYVNGATGSDTLDAGRGESESKPFKTIQACLNYVSDNYNISRYTATVNIADGIYNENLNIPKYNSSTGNIVVQGNNENRELVTIRTIECEQPINFTIRSVSFVRTTPFSSRYGIISIRSGTLNLYNICVDCTQIPTSSASFSALWIRDSGVVVIPGESSESRPIGLYIKLSEEAKVLDAISVQSGGKCNFNADLTLDGNSSSSFTTMSAQGLSIINFIDSNSNYPGRKPIVNISGIINGKRYTIVSNSIINTGGGGEEFLPGAVAGMTGSGGQYI